MTPFKGIVAVTRGGLVPAAIIARELNIRLIDTICVSTYDHQSIRDAKVLKGWDGDSEGWLIIDDLVDTGKTAKVVRELLPKAHFATIYAKPAGRPLVDTFVNRGQPGHLDLLPLGHRAAVFRPDRRDPGEALRGPREAGTGVGGGGGASSPPHGGGEVSGAAAPDGGACARFRRSRPLPLSLRAGARRLRRCVGERVAARPCYPHRHAPPPALASCRCSRPVPAAAQLGEVDAALVLVVDASWSIERGRLCPACATAWQRRFRSPALVRAVEDGPRRGAVA